MEFSSKNDFTELLIFKQKTLNLRINTKFEDFDKKTSKYVKESTEKGKGQSVLLSGIKKKKLCKYKTLP